MLDNILLMTDVYKMSHMLQYPPDTDYVYSYLEARKPGHKVIFFGLQYILKEYLFRPVTHEQVDEFLVYYQQILGSVPEVVTQNMNRLADLGHWPVHIKAIPEGSFVETQNALLTICNTIPEFYWCVGFLESLLLKLWNPCTVATYSNRYLKLVDEFAEKTCDDNFHVPFQVHDFGYRGVSSEETAAISGASHLLNFYGSDTIIANKFLRKYYGPIEPDSILGLSVPASEHSVMCAYGRGNEFQAFDRMLELYPSGIVSIVSDTYDYWNILENYTELRKDEILARDGKVVFRPDSGNPVKVICGDPDAPKGPARLGSLEVLWNKFGGTLNAKGYRVLNPKVGLIYGDAMYYERFEETLTLMKENGFASSNLVIGVGAILLQNHNRDEYGFALKATKIRRNGVPISIYKDPVTDSGKKSKRGLMRVVCSSGKFITIDDCTPEEEESGCLQTVFINGHIEPISFTDVRQNMKATGGFEQQ